jgi:ABC-2 type transport system permease protein
MAANNLLYFVFWLLLFERVPSIRGYALGDVAVMFGVVATGFGIAVSLGGGVLRLSKLIDDGDLDPLLTQPKPTLLYAVGMRSHASGLGDFASGVGLIVCSGVVPLTRAPLVTLAVLASALMFVACGILFFSVAFWIKKSEALTRQWFDLVIAFASYPEPLFGGALKLALFTLIPAGLVGYVPVAAVREPSLLGIGLLVSAPPAYLTLSAWVFGRGLRRYASGSRFGVFA